MSASKEQHWAGLTIRIMAEVVGYPKIQRLTRVATRMDLLAEKVPSLSSKRVYRILNM